MEKLQSKAPAKSKSPLFDKLQKTIKGAKDVRNDLMDGQEITVEWVNKNRPVSYSSLKNFRKSPQHYMEYLKGEFVQTPAMIEGSVVDLLLLTPELIDDRVVISPVFDRRTKIGKADFAAFVETSKGKLVIDEETIERIFKAVEAVHKDKDAMYYLDRVKKTQVPLLWKDPVTGLKTRGYTDAESDPEDKDYFILDLKKAADGSQNRFIRQAYDLDYHLQCGGYTLGYKRQKFRFPDYVNLVVETKAPFAVNVFRADSRYIEASQNEYQNTLLAFKYCIDNKLFHQSYAFHRFSTRYHRMELPGYYRKVFG